MLRVMKNPTPIYLFNEKKIMLTPILPKSPSDNKKNGLITLTQGNKLFHFVHKNHESVESRSIFLVDSGLIVNKPDPSIDP